MKLAITILICRFINFLSKLTKREGSVIGGYWALRICPDVLKRINYPKYVIGISGSSGKGTTTELVYHILKTSGLTVDYNRNGSNAINAITSLILKNSSLKGNFKKDVLLMELDEKYSVSILENFDLTHLILTNITRDQPPRNAHPEYIFNELSKIMNDKTKVIVNADDPFLYYLTYNNKNAIYYGMEKNNYSKKTTLNNLDAAYCPICHRKLDYKFYHYGHLGSYSCPNNDFERPTLSYEAHNIKLNEKEIYINEEKIHIPTNFLYYVYSTTAAYALANTLGIKKEKILYALNTKPLKSKRLNIFNFYNRKWQMLASKNENNLSYKQSLDYIVEEPGTKTIILGFDNSSRRYNENDLSWLWDIDFEELTDKSIDKILIIGRFRYDVLTRLEYAKIDKNKLILIDNLETDLINTLKNKTTGNIYSMVCFDKEIEMKNLLKKEGVIK